MKNKTLLRIVKKSLGVQSEDDLSSLLDQSNTDNEFRERLLNCLEMVDNAITDLDRVIDIRDRSLGISSNEMMALNEKIKAESQKQKAVLDQLHGILHLLSDEQMATDEMQKDELNVLVAKVNQLVKNQLRSTHDLKAFFDEGLHISSAMSFKALEVQFQESVSAVIGDDIQIKIYFAGFLFNNNAYKDEKNTFYSCNHQNEPDKELKTGVSSGESYQAINSSKGNGILAFVKIESEEGAHAREYWARLQPLLPNVATTLENIRLVQDEKRRQRLETELQTARFVQQALLPPSVPMTLGDSLEICGFYQNASDCGGDWWSHIKMADGRNVVFVGDVTGHGTASAMICAVVKGYCDSFADRNGIMLSTMFEELNQVVYRVAKETGHAMTMAAVAFAPAHDEITFVNAGHPPPLRLRRDEDDEKSSKPVVQYLISPGNMLGLNEHVKYKEKTFPITKGDAILLYSDGVIEYTRHNKEIYGDRRLYRVFALAGLNATAYDLNQAVIRDLREFALGDEPVDDITAVVIKAN